MGTTPSISTLIKDCEKLVTSKGWFTDELGEPFSRAVTQRLQESWGVNELSKDSQRDTLRMSKLGKKCPKALWYEINHPELREALPPWAEVKFAFGHILEALALTMARASGHRVEGEQDAVFLEGITGHRDCVLDGCIVDVKSCSSLMYKKYKTGSILQDDPFGALDQVDAYVAASLADPLVTIKDRGYVWAIDKTLGHTCLYEHKLRTDSIVTRIKEYKRIVENSSPPTCACGTVAEGKSGNIRLDVRASYSAYKHCCFPKLRTFLYASGPVYLVKVERKPDVVEIDKNGKIVYA